MKTRVKTASVDLSWWVMLGAASAVTALALLAAGPAKSDEASTPAVQPATQSTTQSGAQDDPLEHLNRFTSGFNRALRDALIDPLVDGYQYVTPRPMQEGVSNFFSNLSEPATVVSSILQGDGDNAGQSTKRFLINTTIGLGGLRDSATDMGYGQRREDLGQAFGANGVESGPHVVLPILGPSNLRDVTGDVITGLLSPLPLAAAVAGGAVEYSDNQDAIKSIDGGAVDPYVAEREAYEQNRSYQVSNGAMPEADFPSFAANTPTESANNPR